MFAVEITIAWHTKILTAAVVCASQELGHVQMACSAPCLCLRQTLASQSLNTTVGTRPGAT
jgi:hypothetical protein